MGEHGCASDEQCDIRIGTATLHPSVAWELPHHQAVPLASNSQYINIYIQKTYFSIFNIMSICLYILFYSCSLEYFKSPTDFAVRFLQLLIAEM